MSFTGFTSDAFSFYRDLGEDNSKSYWRQHLDTFQRAVHTPMAEMVAELSEEFGAVRMLRPQRDTRMSNDKSPYKTYQGALVDLEPALGFWVQLDASGMYASGRFYPRDPREVERLRAVVAEERAGSELAALVAVLRQDGFTVGGDRLKTRPRGIPADHPRVELLRHRTLDIGLTFTPAAALSGSMPEQVSATWRAVRPVLDWVSANIRGTERKDAPARV